MKIVILIIVSILFGYFLGKQKKSDINKNSGTDNNIIDVEIIENEEELKD